MLPRRPDGRYPVGTRLIHIALAAAAALAVPLGLHGAARDWSEVRSTEFVLRARIGDAHFDAVACDVQRVVGALRPLQDVASPVASVAITAVDSERETRDLLPQFWEHRGARPVGAYWSGLHGHHIVVRVDTKAQERFRRVLHEYVHFVTHLEYPNPPRWLDEGLSELWTHAVIAADAIEIGRPVAKHLKAFRSGDRWIPLAELLSAPELPASRDGKKVALFYAESWALAHYLAFERTGGSLAFEIPGSAAAPTDEELRAYVRNIETSAASITIPIASGCGHNPVARRQISAVEWLVLKAQALADGERPEAAVPVILDALRLEPDNPRALETLGFVHFTGNRSGQAAEAFDRVIAAGRASYVSYFYRAVLADVIPRRSDGFGPVPAAEYLERAVLLNPEFVPAREQLERLKLKL